MFRSEIACSQLCQHPSCWKVNNHVMKLHSSSNAFRQSVVRSPSTSSEPTMRYSDDDLPTQSVVNIMQQFDDLLPVNPVLNPVLKYLQSKPNQESKKQHRQQEMSMNVLNLENSARSTPLSSPGSRRLSSSAAQLSIESSPAGPSTVEIHEIYEPNDLNEKWHETFVTRSCYVWVPKRRPIESSSPTDSKSTGGKPVPKDVTEEMLPLEIENSREANIMKREMHKLPPIVAVRGYIPKKSDKETAGNLSENDDLVINAGDMGSLAFIDTLTQHKMKLWDGTSRAVKAPVKNAEQVYRLDERLDALKSASTLLDPDKMSVEISTVPRRKSRASRVAMPAHAQSQNTRAFMYKQNKPELKLSPIPSTTSFSRSRNVQSAETTARSHEDQQHLSPFDQCAECQAKMTASSTKLPKSSEGYFAADHFIPPQPPSTPLAMHSPQRTLYSNFASPEHRNYSPQRAATKMEDTSASAAVGSLSREAPVGHRRSASKDDIDIAARLSASRGMYALQEKPGSQPVYQTSDYIVNPTMHHSSNNDDYIEGTNGAYGLYRSLENFPYALEYQGQGQGLESMKNFLAIHGEGLHVLSRHDALRGQSAPSEMVTKPSPWKLDEGIPDASMILVNVPRATITEASVEDVESARREIPIVPYSTPSAGRIEMSTDSARQGQDMSRGHGGVVVNKLGRDVASNSNENNTRRDRSRSPGFGGGRMPLAMRVAYLGEIPLESSRVPQVSARTATVNYEPAVKLDSLKLDDYGLGTFRTVDEPAFVTPYPSLVVEASAITFGSKQTTDNPAVAGNSESDTKQTTFMTQEQDVSGEDPSMEYNSSATYDANGRLLEAEFTDNAAGRDNVAVWDSTALESLAQSVVNVGLNNAAAVLLEHSLLRASDETHGVNDDHLDMFGATDASLRQQLEEEYKRLSS